MLGWKEFHTRLNDCDTLSTSPNSGYFTVGSTPEFRKAFVARLKQACDQSTIVPPIGRGRQQYIADHLKVGAEAVSKWFKGVAMPRQDKLAHLAELLETDQSWLAFGIKPEMDRKEMRLHARESDGARHLVLGLIMLAGGHCGEPGKTDPRRAYVDFYATLRGSVYPMHVCLARELSSGHYEVLVPREYRDVRVIAVVPQRAGRFDFIDLPLDVIQEHSSKKSGDYAVAFSSPEAGKYFCGRDPLTRIRNFGELR